MQLKNFLNKFESNNWKTGFPKILEALLYQLEAIKKSEEVDFYTKKFAKKLEGKLREYLLDAYNIQYSTDMLPMLLSEKLIKGLINEK